jgi:hypothetical protein
LGAVAQHGGVDGFDREQAKERLSRIAASHKCGERAGAWRRRV